MLTQLTKAYAYIGHYDRPDGYKPLPPIQVLMGANELEALNATARLSPMVQAGRALKQDGPRAAARALDLLSEVNVPFCAARLILNAKP